MTLEPVPASPGVYRRDALLLAVILAAVLCAVFAPFVFGKGSLLSSAREVPSIYAGGAVPEPALAGRALDAGAPGWGTEPWLALEHRLVFEQHRWPFWDPYDGYGTPFAAAMQPQPFYPLTALLSIDPSPRAYTWWVLARLFIAGWFAALFVRLFAGRAGALTAGIATMFTGYYLVYYDIPHLSVDVGLPMLLWTTELVVRRPSAPRIAALALAAGLTYLGGMPETALLVMAVAALYGLLRVTSTTQRLRRLVALGGAHVLGIALGAIMIVPFAEFVRHSFNAHESKNIGGFVIGLAADGLWRIGLLTELAPHVFGSLWGSTLNGGAGHNGVRGFFGCAVLVLAVLAVVVAARRRDARLPIVAFFAALAVYAILKRYGNPLVQWTGTLPLFGLVNFPKYVEFLLGDAMALLAGFGVAFIRERRVGTGAIAFAVGVALLLLSYLVAQTRNLVPPGHFVDVYYTALVIAASALLLTGAAAWAGARLGGRGATVACAGLIAIVALEPIAGYAGRTFWRPAATIDENPYAGAPYLKFLDQHVERGRERVFALGGLLYPNWAGANGLADPRGLNAVYPAEYLPFVDAFLSTTPAHQEDQFDRFTGTRAIPLDARLVRRWLSLSSIGFLISPNPLTGEPPPGAFLTKLWDDVAHTIPDSMQAAVRPAVARLDGRTENVLFEHPPYRDVVDNVRVQPGRPVVAADLALDPATYATANPCGGPVTFTLDAERGGRILASASRTIDPKHILSERHWLPLALDLSRFAGTDVQLRFATAASDLCNAWAEWGEPRFTASTHATALPKQKPLFQEVFTEGNAFVYRVPGSLPRISIFHRARRVSNAAETLRVITDPAFDTTKELAVAAAVPPLAPPTRSETARLVSKSDDQDVRVDVDLSAPAILMQNDTFYPGWVATVDGHPVPIMRVDSIFRGIPVDAGHHAVTITYRSATARGGTLVSFLALLAVALMFASPALTWSLRRRAAALGASTSP